METLAGILAIAGVTLVICVSVIAIVAGIFFINLWNE